MLLQGEGIGRPEEEVRRRREGEGTAAKLIQCRTIGDDEQDSVAGGEGRGADEEEGGAAGGAQQVAEEDLGAGTEGEGPPALVQ